MKLTEINAPKSKMNVRDMRLEVNNFFDIFDIRLPGEDVVSVERYDPRICYYAFLSKDEKLEKNRLLLKKMLRGHGFYVSDTYDPHGSGVEWSYTPFDDD
jgi:hypothetical protein